MENSEYQPTVGRLGYAFQNGMYGKTVLTLFLRKLFIGLWTLLLIVPGIVKSYEYRMVPYLLADDPNMTRQDAFRLSKELMYGQKWDTFVLDLSFIGWSLLSVCTCGLLAIFYVNPYVQATNAELFLELKTSVFRKPSERISKYVKERLPIYEDYIINSRQDQRKNISGMPLPSIPNVSANTANWRSSK